MKQLTYHPPTEKGQTGYYTLHFGKKWYKKRQSRARLQKQSRKENR